MPQVTKPQVLQFIQAHRIVAIVRLDDLSQAVSLSRALAAGGVVAQEYTLTNPQALTVLRTVQQALTEDGYQAHIGIGSVRTLDEAHAALDAGADFVVSPITSEAIIQCCNAAGVAVMPGAYTPTEINVAWQAGADVVKVFPARLLGPSYIKDVLAPMPYLKLMPTGGVDLTNIQTFLKCGAVALGVGGNLVDAVAIKEGNWQAVTDLAKKYSDAAKLQASNTDPR